MFISSSPNPSHHSSLYLSSFHSSDTPTEINEPTQPYGAPGSPVSCFVDQSKFPHQEDKGITDQTEVIQNRLKEIFNSPVAKKIVGIQKQMQEENRHPNIMVVAESSDSQQSRVYVTPSSFRVVERSLGKGAQGEVFAVKRLFNDSDKPDAREALKFSAKPLSGSSLLHELPDEGGSYLNVPMQSYTVESVSSRYCDVLPLADSDFKKFDILTVEKPIQCMLNLMKDVARGADALHQKGVIHRDIKPDNILVLEGGKRAQLGDLDLAMRMLKEEHRTTCTPIYAPPSIWANDLVKQAERIGFQTQKDDVFSLGRTIQYGLISKIFNQYRGTSFYCNYMEPKLLKDLKNESQVDISFKKYDPLKKVLIVCESQKIPDKGDLRGFKIIPKNLLIFPSRDELNKNNLEAFNLIKDKLNTNESKALSLAIKLAYDLQANNPLERPSMKKIEDKIEEFQVELKNSVSAASVSASVSSPVSASLQIEESPQRVEMGESSQAPKRIKTQHQIS